MTRDETARRGYAAFREYANAHAEQETGIPGGYPEWESLPDVCKEANRRFADEVQEMVVRFAVAAIETRDGSKAALSLNNLLRWFFTPQAEAAGRSPAGT